MRIVYYEKPYDDDAVIIDLANAHSLKGIPGINLSDAIKSRRAFLNQSVSLEELSFLLWATQRNTPGNIQGPAKGIFAGN